MKLTLSPIVLTVIVMLSHALPTLGASVNNLGENVDVTPANEADFQRLTVRATADDRDGDHGRRCHRCPWPCHHTRCCDRDDRDDKDDKDDKDYKADGLVVRAPTEADDRGGGHHHGGHHHGGHHHGGHHHGGHHHGGHHHGGHHHGGHHHGGHHNDRRGLVKADDANGGYGGGHHGGGHGGHHGGGGGHGGHHGGDHGGHHGGDHGGHHGGDHGGHHGGHHGGGHGGHYNDRRGDDGHRDGGRRRCGFNRHTHRCVCLRD